MNHKSPSPPSLRGVFLSPARDGSLGAVAFARCGSGRYAALSPCAAFHHPGTTDGGAPLHAFLAAHLGADTADWPGRVWAYTVPPACSHSLAGPTLRSLALILRGVGQLPPDAPVTGSLQALADYLHVEPVTTEEAPLPDSLADAYCGVAVLDALLSAAGWLTQPPLLCSSCCIYHTTGGETIVL